MRFSLLVSCLLVSASQAFVPARPAFSRAPSPLSVAIDTSDIKNGLTVEIDGDPFKVLSFSIMKQARGAAKTTMYVAFVRSHRQPVPANSFLTRLVALYCIYV